MFSETLWNWVRSGAWVENVKWVHRNRRHQQQHSFHRWLKLLSAIWFNGCEAAAVAYDTPRNENNNKWTRGRCECCWPNDALKINEFVLVKVRTLLCALLVSARVGKYFADAFRISRRARTHVQPIRCVCVCVWVLCLWKIHPIAMCTTASPRKCRTKALDFGFCADAWAPPATNVACLANVRWLGLCQKRWKHHHTHRLSVSSARLYTP